jgi:rod shape-determining protein MreC
MNLSLWDKLGDWLVLLTALFLSAALLVARNETAMLGFRTRALEWSSAVENRLAWIGDYVGALEENRRLREDNIRLSSQVARLRGHRVENDRLRSLLALRDTLRAEMVAARVISKTLSTQRGLLTLDVGARDGVAQEMAVVDERGVVGKTVLVSERFSRVMPLLNTDLRVPAKIEPSGAAGILRWQGDRRDRLIMEHVVKTEPVRPGQRVVASGHSQVFPVNYSVGVVDSVLLRPGRIEFTIYVRPSASVDDADHVFVVTALPDSERTALEALQIQ